MNYDTYELASGMDYVPDLDLAEGEVDAGFVKRAQLQASQLNAIDGVSALDGSLNCLDEVEVALEEAIDLWAEVERFGD